MKGFIMAKKMTVAEEIGQSFADTIMRCAHAMYNAPRGKKMVQTCIDELQRRIQEIKPKKADPAYKEARYGKKKKK